LEEIVDTHTDVEFHFIGPASTSNLGQFRLNPALSNLMSRSNVISHGEMEPAEVASLIHHFDLFLICYDSNTFEKEVSNNHKLLEYLSTGKVVVSTYTSSYLNLADKLFIMARKVGELPRCFEDAVHRIDELNSPAASKARREFALGNTYARQLEKIEELLTSAGF